MATGLFGLGSLYKHIVPATAIRDMLEAREMVKSGENGVLKLIDRIDVTLGICYLNLNNPDSAFIYLNGLYERISHDDFH